MAHTRWILGAGLLAALATSCGGGGTALKPDPGGSGSDPGVVHVHGLGVNPADGTLYAATHTGLFRIPEQGKAKRIADLWQDTMGFTVVGPNHFLGSGHPDMREYRAKRSPSLLGLVESADTGVTWHALSLSGQADFHGLQVVQGRIYGFDSTGGAFMVSSDGARWETRSTVAMRDFAVSPVDPEVVIAAMARDVQRSRDGGRSWEPVDAPSLALLAWQEAGALWGITATGALYQSADAGQTWTRAGAIAGAPEAFLAQGRLLYVAISGGIYRSDDGGTTWQLRYRENA